MSIEETSRAQMRWSVLAVVVFTAIGILMWVPLKMGMDRQETMECGTWERQALEFPRQYYITVWQYRQCKAHGLFINAPVKDSQGRIIDKKTL